MSKTCQMSTINDALAIVLSHLSMTILFWGFRVPHFDDELLICWRPKTHINKTLSLSKDNPFRSIILPSTKKNFGFEENSPKTIRPHIYILHLCSDSSRWERDKSVRLPVKPYAQFKYNDFFQFSAVFTSTLPIGWLRLYSRSYSGFQRLDITGNAGE